MDFEIYKCTCEPGGLHGSLLCNHWSPGPFCQRQGNDSLWEYFTRSLRNAGSLLTARNSCVVQIKLSHMNCLRSNPDHLIRTSEPCQKPDEVADIHDLSASARWDVSGQLASSVQYSSRNSPESWPLRYLYIQTYTEVCHVHMCSH